MSAPILLSVVRGAEGLYALLGTTTDAGFVVAPVALEQVRESLYPPRDRLRQAWSRLAEAGSPAMEVARDALTVLLETVPELPAPKPPVALAAEWGQSTPPPKRTAAHPRGYRGTKRKPTKTRAEQIDLRPHFCDAASLRMAGEKLASFRDRARRSLIRDRYAEDAIDAASAELFGEEHGKRVWQLPPAFVSFLWRRLRTLPWTQVSPHLTLFAELELDSAQATLAAYARLLALAEPDTAYRWGCLCSAVQSTLRAELLHLVCDGRSYAAPPRDGLCASLQEISANSDMVFAAWARELLAVERRRESPDYLLAGFRLAAEFDSRHQPGDAGRCDNYPADAVRELAIHTGKGGSWLAIEMWRACGKYREVAGLFAASQWRNFPTPAAVEYVRFLSWIFDYAPGGRAGMERRATTARAIPAVERFVVETPPEYQRKAIECIADWLYSCADAAEIEARLPHAFLALRRMSAPPFDSEPAGRRAIWFFAGAPREADIARFLSAPDASFLALERECGRDNTAALVNSGLSSLCNGAPRLAIDAFLTAPGKLFRTARKLGSLAEPERARLVKECARNSLVRIDALRARLDQVCEVIAARSRPGMANPIPAQLTKWMRGELTLTPGRIDRYRRVLAERLTLTRLDLIDQAVVERASRGLPAPEQRGREEFALLLAASVARNRRGLRKFLQAWWSGDRDYLDRHPATAAWYRKHPAVRREVWGQGIAFEKAGRTIAVEQDPFEVLKLGEYAGSCLGLGGSNSASAAAALIDANKQVLYARDRQGQIVGRQLVAISEEERLVCFSVYPQSAGVRLRSLFRAYDLAFAEALGLPIYRRGEFDDGYAIARILSQDWYDDYAWDLHIDEDSRAGRAAKRRAKVPAAR